MDEKISPRQYCSYFSVNIETTSSMSLGIIFLFKMVVDRQKKKNRNLNRNGRIEELEFFIDRRRRNTMPTEPVLRLIRTRLNFIQMKITEFIWSLSFQ